MEVRPSLPLAMVASSGPSAGDDGIVGTDPCSAPKSHSGQFSRVNVAAVQASRMRSSPNPASPPLAYSTLASQLVSVSTAFHNQLGAKLEHNNSDE
jgi:hypothetical protein